MPTLNNFLSLFLSTLFAFIVTKLTNNAFNIQIISIFIALYVVSLLLKKSNKIFLVFLLNSSLLLMLEKTGGLNSPLFFLSFFSSFIIAFLLSKADVFVFLLTTTLFFLPSVLKTPTFSLILPLFSLFLLSPLAYFFSLYLNQKKETEVYVENLESSLKKSSESILSAIDVLKKNGSFNEKGKKEISVIEKETKQIEEEI